MALPHGFTSRIVATTRERVAGTDYVWHGLPDGGATFPLDDGGWVYVSNGELGNNRGGVGYLRFDEHASVIDAGEAPRPRGPLYNTATACSTVIAWTSPSVNFARI